MNRDRILRAGVAGAAVVGVCCFTPLLVVLFGALGLTAVLAWADYVLLPLLAVFLGITAYALVRRRRQ